MSYKSYACTKCSSTECETGEIRTTGAGLSRFLNLQNQKYSTISCSKCGYTDIYKRDSGGGLMDVLDIFSN